MAEVTCRHERHGLNSAYAGWNDGVLLSTTGPAGGVICPGCAAYNATLPVTETAAAIDTAILNDLSARGYSGVELSWA